jgi:4-amino-4-deoxy-L-arabinose transferase-like glycosyltransferase
MRKEACSFIVSAFLAISIALITSATWLHASARIYSFKNLLPTASVVFALIVWIVWLITRQFLRWINTKPLNLNRRDYIALGIALIPLLASIYHGWNSYGGKYVLSTFASVFEVEVAYPDNAEGNICILEIKNQSGEKVQKDSRSISETQLTGNWVTESEDCQYFSKGSTPGSLKFKYFGKPDQVFQILFRENQDAGKALVRVNGEQVAEINLFAKQEGNKQIVVPMHLSHINVIVWNIILTFGWMAVLSIVLMGCTLLLKNINIPTQIRVLGSSLYDIIEKRPYISLILILVGIVIMFWPRGFFASPDVGYYLSLAKNLYYGNGYVNPDLSPNIYRGPVLPLLVYVSYILFGESFQSAVIMERIFWFLTIMIAYLFGRQLYSHRVGFLAAFFVLIASVINESFTRIWTDGPLIFAILVLQLMFWQAFIKQRDSKWYALMGILMGTTYLLKQTVIFIAPLPFLTWLIFSEYRTRRIFKKLLIFYLVFALFYFGWDMYVYLAGGSSGQIIGTIKTGIYFLSYISRGLSSASNIQNSASQEDVAKTSSLIALVDIFRKFYIRDILNFFRIGLLFPIALSFILYQAVTKKRKSDVFLVIGLFLYVPLILVQATVNFGFRQNLYFYCITLILIATMLDRIFGELSSKKLSNGLVMTVTLSLVFIQVSGGTYTFPEFNYFRSYEEIATWVDKHIDSNVRIMVPARESNFLHVLTSGNKRFEITNTCIGEVSASPAEKCTPPYISFWVYNGTTDPNEPRDLLQGISEPALLSSIREKDIQYVFVTPSIYSLYNYLMIHPAFEKIGIIDNIAIFRVVREVQSIASYPDIKWNTCLGRGTPEYLRNLKDANPVRYEMKLRTEIEPWMGLNRQDLEAFMNWQGCQFGVIFPGSYSSP